MKISILNRLTNKTETENVYYEGSIRFLYGNSFLSRTIGRFFLHTIFKWPCVAGLIGLIQKSSFSKRNIKPFIARFNIDATEFAKNVDDFTSFNDFFIRSLKPGARKLSEAPIVIPADGRYRFYETIGKGDLFNVKGKSFCLQTLLRDEALSKRFTDGSMVLARLCPTDVHRFYFPCNATPGPTRLINGPLYSVNPIAIKNNPWIYGTNRRTVTLLETPQFGKVAFLEIGATSVGSIKQTFTPGKAYSKCDEKGYFEFGGSALILLFEKGAIRFDDDLLKASSQGIETHCLIGQSLGQVQ